MSLQCSIGALGLYEFHAQALRQILTNLVKNAAVHSGGTRITVRFNVEETEKECFGQLVVEDDALGIPEHKLNKLMQPFEAGQESMGSGLGLYITSELAKVAKGDLVYSGLRWVVRALPLSWTRPRLKILLRLTRHLAWRASKYCSRKMTCSLVL